jgi:hypothetical protein
VTTELHHLLRGAAIGGQLRDEVMAEGVDRGLSKAGNVLQCVDPGRCKRLLDRGIRVPTRTGGIAVLEQVVVAWPAGVLLKPPFKDRMQAVGYPEDRLRLRLVADDPQSPPFEVDVVPPDYPRASASSRFEPPGGGGRTLAACPPTRSRTMAKNRVQFQKGLSLPDFFAAYGREAQCAETLFTWRWPLGFVCPECGHAEGWADENPLRVRQLTDPIFVPHS